MVNYREYSINTLKDDAFTILKRDYNSTKSELIIFNFSVYLNIFSLICSVRYREGKLRSRIFPQMERTWIYTKRWMGK